MSAKEHLSRICAGGFSGNPARGGKGLTARAEPHAVEELGWGALMSLVLSMPQCAGKLLRAQHGVPV
jgi:hypothetical protein